MSNPVTAIKTPYPVYVEGGKTYFWCACGRSKEQPFCDGSHQGTEFQPVQFIAEDDEMVYLCGCKYTSNKPYCDDHHFCLSKAQTELPPE